MTEPSASEQSPSAKPASAKPASAKPASAKPASAPVSGQPSGGSQRPGSGASESWEQRAAGLASEIQRWLIRKSAQNMRDEVGSQVKRAIRGSERNTGDSWATATTEPPHAADEAPECAWCPVCRAARRLAHARAAGSDSRGGPRYAADVMAGAVRDALAGIDSMLSYRPGAAASGAGAPGAPAAPARPEPPAAAEPDTEQADVERADDTSGRA